jgi:hypothetical protein
LVADRAEPAGRGADEVAADDVTGSAGVDQGDAVLVAGDDVPVGDALSADRVVGAEDAHARHLRFDERPAAVVGQADPVAGDGDVGDASRDLDAGEVEAVDGQPAHGAGRRAGGEANAGGIIDRREVLAVEADDGRAVKPSCVVPSMETVSVTSGSGVAGRIWTAPLPMLNAISSGPVLALACVIASRREPAPVSAVVVTVKVENNCRPSRFSTTGLTASAAIARKRRRASKAAISEAT